MAKPQQAELRRSGKVPALDPDASGAKLSAQDVPTTTGSDGSVPVDQRPGHHPDHDQDKPDLNKFAERLGIVSDEEVPPEAPHVEEGSKVTRLKPTVETAAPSRAPSSSASSSSSAKPDPEKRTFSPIGLALVGPVTGILIAKRALQELKRLRG